MRTYAAHLSSIGYTHRLDEKTLTTLPRIPAQPIGYGDAQVLFQ